jgi:hypothetical protein
MHVCQSQALGIRRDPNKSLCAESMPLMHTIRSTGFEVHVDRLSLATIPVDLKYCFSIVYGVKTLD